MKKKVLHLIGTLFIIMFVIAIAIFIHAIWWADLHKNTFNMAQKGEEEAATGLSIAADEFWKAHRDIQLGRAECEKMKVTLFKIMWARNKAFDGVEKIRQAEETLFFQGEAGRPWYTKIDWTVTNRFVATAERYRQWTFQMEKGAQYLAAEAELRLLFFDEMIKKQCKKESSFSLP